MSILTDSRETAITWIPKYLTDVKSNSLRWRHNDHAGVSNHQPHGCLLNRLFRRKSKKTSKPRVTGLCAGNSSGTVEFPAQRPVTRSFDVFFDLRLNKRLSKQPWSWWFETPAWSLWRHRNDSVIISTFSRATYWYSQAKMFNVRSFVPILRTNGICFYFCWALRLDSLIKLQSCLYMHFIERNVVVLRTHLVSYDVCAKLGNEIIQSTTSQYGPQQSTTKCKVCLFLGT